MALFLQVQFGHAGSCANSDMETATAKNKSLDQAGAYVPSTFDELGETIRFAFSSGLQLSFILSCHAARIALCFIDRERAVKIPGP